MQNSVGVIAASKPFNPVASLGRSEYVTEKLRGCYAALSADSFSVMWRQLSAREQSFWARCAGLRRTRLDALDSADRAKLRNVMLRASRRAAALLLAAECCGAVPEPEKPERGGAKG